MNLLETFALKRSARREALAGVDSVEDYVMSVLGPRPAFDPVGNHGHTFIANDLNNRAEIEELDQDRRRAEDELTRHPLPVLLTAFLVFLFVVEMIGCTLVIRALGYDNPERLLMGVMLAAFVFFITGVAARLGTSRGWWFYGVLVVYAVLVVAVATLRIGEMESVEGTTAAGDLAAGMVMLFATVGPAWLAETMMRRRAPAVRLAREIRNLRRRIRRANVAQSRARTFVDRTAQDGARWDVEAAQRRALYNRVHRLTSAEQTGPDGGGT